MLNALGRFFKRGTSGEEKDPMAFLDEYAAVMNRHTGLEVYNGFKRGHTGLSIDAGFAMEMRTIFPVHPELNQLSQVMQIDFDELLAGYIDPSGGPFLRQWLS